VYYVYVYLDPRKQGRYPCGDISVLYEPFYIGKGHGRRCFTHLRRIKNLENNHLKNKILKILAEFSKENFKRYILIIKDNLSEEDALKLETSLIETIGRADLKKGPLTNLTNGGDGLKGISEETREKMRIAKLGGTLSAEHRKKISVANLGRKQSTDSKRRISEKHIGMKASKESKRKMSEAKKGKPGNRAGIPASQETIEKMRQVKLGGKLSEEHKRRIAQSVKVNWICRKDNKINGIASADFEIHAGPN